ncbi:MAG TPA: S-adenosylmethionine:tRNA ribosyltransferase-isomerase [Kofleriaceae bacterium]|nr:S-adenosylmethionine:tRNA ribosyltransferase-isomerase [Kofleriaceae bacterium]
MTTAVREHRADARLLVLEAETGRLLDRAVGDLPELLLPGDLLVLNDAATLPASLPALTAGGDAIELRLTGPPGRSTEGIGRDDQPGAVGPSDDDLWPAVVLGAGDWRTRTEDRPAPPALAPGDRLAIAGGMLDAEVVAQGAISPRLVHVRFDLAGAALWRALYRAGRPVQYAHHADDLDLWTVQTVYAGRPWAVEMPSAGRPLDWRTLGALRQRGIELAWLTHAAGLSATGDPAIDAALPLPERYDIPPATCAAVARARAAGRRVIAVGTTVVRALEGAARSGALSGVTDLVIAPDTLLRLVDGVLTGIHAPGESHYRLLGAFAPEHALAGAARHADAGGYLPHELGDLCLIVPSLAADEARYLAAAS